MIYRWRCIDIVAGVVGEDGDALNPDGGELEVSIYAVIPEVKAQAQLYLEPSYKFGASAS